MTTDSRPHPLHAQTFTGSDHSVDKEQPPLRPVQTVPSRHLSHANMAEYSRSVKAPATSPFAGRLGGNQEFIVDRHDPANAALIAEIPDAAPQIPWAKFLDLRPLKNIELWKASVVEAIGKSDQHPFTLLHACFIISNTSSLPRVHFSPTNLHLAGSFILVFVTGYIGALPNALPPQGTTPAAVFATASFLGPLMGGITTIILISLLVYTFSSVSGAHFNPLITIGTLFVRVTSLSRAILYVSFQIMGASLAGLMLRAAFHSRDWLVGGCFLFEDAAPVSSAAAVEFMACFSILFLAFGVGLDPRQAQTFGPALAPALVGLAVAVLSFGLAFNRPGYGGPSMNPARCFGVYVGTRFPHWHWVHWSMALAGALGHAVLYSIVPPWTSGLSAEKAHEKIERMRELVRLRNGGDGERGNMVVNNPPVQGHEIGRQGLNREKE